MTHDRACHCVKHRNATQSAPAAISTPTSVASTPISAVPAATTSTPASTAITATATPATPTSSTAGLVHVCCCHHHTDLLAVEVGIVEESGCSCCSIGVFIAQRTITLEPPPFVRVHLDFPRPLVGISTFLLDALHLPDLSKYFLNRISGGIQRQSCDVDTWVGPTACGALRLHRCLCSGLRCGCWCWCGCTGTSLNILVVGTTIASGHIDTTAIAKLAATS